MKPAIRLISSMATRLLLAELAAMFEQHTGCAVAVESVGGVDAARRVSDGEPFDAVALASDAIDKLAAAGRVVASSKTDWVHSEVAVAVRVGELTPDIGTEDALRRAVLAARSLGFSTGPSGVALHKLFERWGIADELKERLVLAPPGVPVGALVACGEVELGFQQLSELMNLEGVTVLGPLPQAVRISTTFSAGLCSGSAQAETVRALLEFMNSPQTDDAKRRHGMAPV